MYGWRLQVEAMRRDRFRMSIDQLVVSGISWVELEIPVTVRFHLEARESFTIALLKGGSAERVNGPVFGRGDVFLGASPELEDDCRVSNTVSSSVQFSEELLSELASGDPERPLDGLRFLSRRPIDGGAVRWNAVCPAFKTLTDNPDRAGAPLVIGPVVRLLAASALDASATNATVRNATVGRGDVQPTTVQRAIAFIESNPHIDISVTDIARASFVSARALQLAFRRQLSTTPMAYLRQVRLGHARDELLEATSIGHVTVAGVAHRWGFSSPSRFTAMYRSAYGESPRDTLDR